jgi:hypothetical protein
MCQVMSSTVNKLLPRTTSQTEVSATRVPLYTTPVSNKIRVHQRTEPVSTPSLMTSEPARSASVPRTPVNGHRAQWDGDAHKRLGFADLIEHVT